MTDQSLVLRDRSELEQVWQLADATLRAHSGDVADLAWATMEALAWAWGGLPTAPVTGRTVTVSSSGEVRGELAAIQERMTAARTSAQYARLRGCAEALAFALGDAGPFWWSDLAAAVAPTGSLGSAGRDAGGGATAAR